MNILVSVLWITFLGSSVFSQIQVNFKSEHKLLSDLFDVKIIKTDNPSLNLESKNKLTSQNEDDMIDKVPTS